MTLSMAVVDATTAVAVPVAPVTCAGQPAVDDRAAQSFLHDLQQKIARDDRQAVAAMVRYPLTVFAGGVRIPIAGAAARRSRCTPAAADRLSRRPDRHAGRRRPGAG